MSSSTRRRLEEALNAGKDIAKSISSDSVTNGDSSCNSLVQVDFDDVMGVYSVKFSPKQQYLVVGCGNGAIQVYECNTGRRKLLKHGSLHGLPTTSVKFFPFKDDELITAGADGMMMCWDLETWKSFKKIEEPHNEISALDFSHDGRIFATAGKDKDVRVYDSSTLKLKRTFGGTGHLDVTEEEDIFAPGVGHGRKVFAVKFHPFNDNVFLTGGWDRCLKVWDVRVDQVVRSIHGPYICGDGIDMWEDSILTASWVARNALQVWDYGSGELIESIPFPCQLEHGEFLYVARFCSSYDLIAAGGSGTNDLKIINRSENKVIASVEGEGKPIQALDVSHDGTQLVIGSTGNSVHIKTLT